MESIDAFIDRLPKVELHLHLVGSASVPTVLELARRHPDGPGAAVPRSAAELSEALDIAARSAWADHGVRIAYIFDIAGELGAAAALALAAALARAGRREA